MPPKKNAPIAAASLHTGSQFLASPKSRSPISASRTIVQHRGAAGANKNSPGRRRRRRIRFTGLRQKPAA